jgi:hypothetical protein
MPRRTLVTVLAAGLLATSFATAQPQPAAKEPRPATPPASKPANPAAQPGKDQQPPAIPGMTEEQMKACMEAATPGEQHAFLAKGVGTWDGKSTCYMPGMPPTESSCVTVITPLFDNRFFKSETTGEMPGMGPFTGFGLSGYDNVGKEFQLTWVDNFGTGMMTGKGELSSDKKTMTWTCSYNCPLKGGPITARMIERFTGPNTMVMEMHGPDPVSGKEAKMMEISYTRRAGATATVPTGH